MATTILPKKAGQENPMALDDDQHNALAADPTIPQFVQGSTYETSTVSTGTSAFSVPSSGGFSSPSSFASPAAGFGSSSATGAGSFTTPAPTTSFGGSSFGSTPQPTTLSSSGKPMPMQPEQPEL